MPNFYSLNITTSGSLRLYNKHDDIRTGKGFFTNVTNRGLEFNQHIPGINPVTIIQLSSSNREPRFGIGFSGGEKFDKTFDLLSSKDSVDGTEIQLRSSRTEYGAQAGDIAGKISFAIQSASFKSIDTSGSVGDIRARVDTITDQGVIGSLILGTYGSKYNRRDTLTINSFKSTFSSSLEVLNDITNKGGIRSTGLISSSLLRVSRTITGNAISASAGLYTAGDLFVAGNILTTPPPGNAANGIEFRIGNAVDQVDKRWTALREGVTSNLPSGFNIALTGSFYHTGSYVFNGGTVDMQNVIFSLGGFNDVSSSLAMIDAGVF